MGPRQTNCQSLRLLRGGVWPPWRDEWSEERWGESKDRCLDGPGTAGPNPGRRPVGRPPGPTGVDWTIRTPLGRLRTPLGRLRTLLGRLRTLLGRLRTPLGRLRTPLGRLRTSRTHFGRPRLDSGRSGPLWVVLGRLWVVSGPFWVVSGPFWVVSILLWVVSGPLRGVSGLVGPTSGDLGLASAGPLQVVCMTSRTHWGRLWTIRTPLGRLRTPLGRLRTSRTHLGRPRLGVCRSPGVCRSSAGRSGPSWDQWWLLWVVSGA